MRKLLAIMAFFLCASMLKAQTHTFPATDTDNTFTGENTFTGQVNTSLAQYTVATLPVPGSSQPGLLVIVTDALTAGTCTPGGGSQKVLCRNSGSAWEPISGSGGGGSGTINPGTTGHLGSYAGSTTIGDSGIPATSVVSKSADNAFTLNNRFGGPIPWIDITSVMPQGGCSERNGAGLTATMAASSTTVAVTGTFFAAYVNGCGVMIESAGPTSTLSTPSISSVTSHGTGGSTTIVYQIVAIDNFEGYSAASAPFSFTTSDTYANLVTRHYNFIKGTTVANAVLYCLFSDKGTGGSLSPLYCDAQPTFRDQGAQHNVDGSTRFPPTFLPATPPVAVGPQALFTTIVSGGGTHTWIVADASSNIAAGTLAIHDISLFLNQAVAIAQQFSGTYGFTGEFAPILIPEGNYTIAHWPFATGFNTDLRGALFNVNIPWKVNGTLDGSHASASGGNFQPANQAYINMSNTSSVVLVTSGASTINSIGIVNLVGPGIRMEEGGSNNILNVSLTNLPTSNSCPLLADGNVIASNFSNNVFTAGTSTTDADGAMCFSMQTSVNADGNLNFTNNWLLEKGVWMDNPARAPRSVMISSNFTSLQTENNVDSGAVNVDSGTSAEFSTVSGMYFNFTTQDNTRNSSSNFTTIFCNNPENIGATCSLGMTDLNRGSANSVRMSNPANNTLEQGSFNSTNSGGAWSGSGFSVGNSTGGGFSSIGDVGAIFDGIGNLDPGGNGSPGISGILPSPYVNSITPSITGGSLAAATYYYKSTGLDSNGGETAVGPETSATVASGSSGSVVLNVLSEMGYQYECYRVYRGTTPGGETGYIGATTVGGLSCTVLGGARTRGYTDTGGTSLTVVTPPVTSKAYWFTMPTDPTVPWYFGIDADTGADFAAPQKPLGIGTRCSGCAAAGVGMDLESGSFKAGKGLTSTFVNLTEGSAASAVSATDVFYGLSSVHWPAFNPNSAGERKVCGLTGSVTSGHIVAFNATGTICDLVDGGTGTGSGTVTNFSANTITTGTQNFATASVTSPGVTPALTYTLANDPAHTVFGNCTAGSSAPDYVALTEACLPNTTVFNDTANTFGAHLNDFSASTIKIPAAAGFTTSSSSNLGLNTTTNNIMGWANSANKIIAAFSAAPTNGNCLKALVSTGNVLVTDSACTGATLQTNSVSNSSQVTLNFTNTVGGNGISFSNPSGGVESATLASSAGGGNAALLCTITGAASGDIVNFDATPKCINSTPGIVINAQTGTTYTVLTGDRGHLTTISNASSIAVTLPQSNTTGFGSNYYTFVKNIGQGTATITPMTSTINGASTLVLLSGQNATIASDNTNYTAIVSGSGVVAFASLPTCTSALEGYQEGVNDSTTVTWGATITGGSTSHVRAYCNASNWTVMGK